MKNRTRDAARARAYFCAYCGERMLDPEKTTLDHIIPKSRGGSNHFRNLTPACFQCNQDRGTKTWVTPCFSVTTGERLTPKERQRIMQKAFLVSMIKKKAAPLEQETAKTK